VGKEGPTGQYRQREQDCGKALAGKHAESAGADARGANAESRYKRIVVDGGQVEESFLKVFVQAQAPRELVLDLDATDDPVHGENSRVKYRPHRALCDDRELKDGRRGFARRLVGQRLFQMHKQSTASLIFS
jgi:hypothetical protein